MLGMVLDESTLRPALGNGGGGVSGRAIHPIAVRAVHDVRAALPELPIVGVGGVASGWDAAELMIAGAARGAGRHRHLRRPPGLRPGARRARDLGLRDGGLHDLQHLNRVLWPSWQHLLS